MMQALRAHWDAQVRLAAQQPSGLQHSTGCLTAWSTVSRAGDNTQHDVAGPGDGESSLNASESSESSAIMCGYASSDVLSALTAAQAILENARLQADAVCQEAGVTMRRSVRTQTDT